MNPSDKQKVTKARRYLISTLVPFISEEQRQTLLINLRGEEAVGIAELVLKAEETIQNCPKTYETEDIETKDKIIYLHYFSGSVDAWIVERDIGDGTDQEGLGTQLQAFGKITLTGDPKDAEWGYINIQELIDNGIELDLYWAPQNLKFIQEIRNES